MKKNKNKELKKKKDNKKEINSSVSDNEEAVESATSANDIPGRVDAEINDASKSVEAVETGPPSGVSPEPDEFVDGIQEGYSLYQENTDSQSELLKQRQRPGIGWIIGVAFAAAFGIAISVYLTTHHYQIMSGLPDYQSFCSLSEYIDCDMVNTSTYSEVFGLPVALYGGCVYAIVFCLVILAIFASPAMSKRYMAVISLLGLVSFCFSIYFAIISTFILHAICILCVGTYFINLFVFLGAKCSASRNGEWFFSFISSYAGYLGFGRRGETDPSETGATKRAWNVAGVFAVIMVIIQGFFAAIYLDAKYLGFTEADMQNFMKRYKEIQRQEIDLADSPYWGADDPDLTIVVFEDFLCSFCKRSHVTAFPIFKEFKDRIKIVFKALPYDRECNTSIKKTLHPGACRSSVAAACASLQGEFKRFQEYFFHNQDVIKPDMDMVEVSKKIGGVDMDAMEACFKQGKGEWLTRRDFKQAMELQVRRTPAYFFNGRKWEGALKPVFIRKVVLHELEVASGKVETETTATKEPKAEEEKDKG